MKNLITRSITGILFVAVILGAIWYSQESFRGLILITTILCLLEFYRLVNENTSRWILYSDILGGTYLVGILFLIPNLQSGLPAIYIFICSTRWLYGFTSKKKIRLHRGDTRFSDRYILHCHWDCSASLLIRLSPQNICWCPTMPSWSLPFSLLYG